MRVAVLFILATAFSAAAVKVFLLAFDAGFSGGKVNGLASDGG